jgi:ENTH domain
MDMIKSYAKEFKKTEAFGYVSQLSTKVKQMALNLTDLEVKVEEATNNEPWGPHGSAMAGQSLATSVAIGHALADVHGTVSQPIVQLDTTYVDTHIAIRIPGWALAKDACTIRIVLWTTWTLVNPAAIYTHEGVIHGAMQRSRRQLTTPRAIARSWAW